MPMAAAPAWPAADYGFAVVDHMGGRPMAADESAAVPHDMATTAVLANFSVGAATASVDWLARSPPFGLPLQQPQQLPFCTALRLAACKASQR